MATAPVLETRNLSKSFGPLRAVSEVNFQVPEGELRAVIGPNGAGKTTFFNLISGKLEPTGGGVYFEGEDITGFPPHAVVKKGVGRSFQITNVFPRLSVLDNVRLAVLAKRGKTMDMLSCIERRAEDRGEALAILGEVELERKAERPTTELGHGERRNLELGITLALEPRLILLDEPTAGMSIEETASTIELVRKISRDKTVVFTEHDMSVVFSIADRISVLHQGSVIAEGAPDEVRGDAAVRLAYLGEEA